MRSPGRSRSRRPWPGRGRPSRSATPVPIIAVRTLCLSCQRRVGGGDHERDQRTRHQLAEDDGRERRPARPTDARPRGAGATQSEHPDAGEGVTGVARGVEDAADQRLATEDRVGDDDGAGPQGEQHERGEEEQAEDERHGFEIDVPGLLAVLEPQRERDAQHEQAEHPPARQDHPGVGVVAVQDRSGRAGNDREHGIEHPDLSSDRRLSAGMAKSSSSSGAIDPISTEDHACLKVAEPTENKTIRAKAGSATSATACVGPTCAVSRPVSSVPMP